MAKSILESLLEKKAEQEKVSLRIDFSTDKELADAISIIKSKIKDSAGIDPKDLFSTEILEPKRKYLLKLASEILANIPQQDSTHTSFINEEQ